jgi:hypothetical protein
MTPTPDDWPSGYVLRGGGPLNNVVVRNRRPDFVGLMYNDGPRELYRPSGEPDVEYPDLERYDYEQLAESE